MFEYIDFNAFLLTQLCSHNLKLCTVDFDLSHNLLTGTLPESIYNMTLKKFKCSNNNLRGTISSNIKNLVDLTVLSIDNNLFSGTIPEDFSMLENVEKIKLEYNDFTGALFDRMGNKSYLGKIPFSPLTLN